MTTAQYSDLAFAYIQGLLPEPQKEEVYRLIANEPAFRIALRNELALAEQLQSFKRETPSDMKQRIQLCITEQTEHQLATSRIIGLIIKPILQASLPELVWLAIEKYQGRVLCLNE